MAFWEDWEHRCCIAWLCVAIKRLNGFLRAALWMFGIGNSNSNPHPFGEIRVNARRPKKTSNPHVVWPETTSINAYANRMALLLLGVKGLGLLLITWITVVLLGGFVSVLKEDDFWSLTTIILIQSVGAFNLLLTEKLTIFPVLFRAIRAGLRIIFQGESSLAIKVTTTLITLVVILHVCLTLFLPMFILYVLYVLGIYISMGISLWRLIENDYGDPDGGSNLKPALRVCYSMAVAQGVLFCSRLLYDFLWKTQVVEQVRSTYKLRDTGIVLAYLRETVAGCQRDTSFHKGRNLVAFAVDQLRGPNPEKHITEVQAVFAGSLGTERQALLKRLIVVPETSSCIISRLLKMLHPRSEYSREAREYAIYILPFLADGIRLDKFPGAIQCISSLLDTSEEYPLLSKAYQLHYVSSLAEVSDHQDWLFEIQRRHNVHKRYELSRQKTPEPFDDMLHRCSEFMQLGLCILGKLADEEDNCRVISNTENLLSRIIAPLISDRLHREHHPIWHGIPEISLGVICKLIAAPGETGAKLGRQISSNSKAITSALESYLECDDCYFANKWEGSTMAVEMVLDLSLDTSSIMASGKGSERFVELLQRNFHLRHSSLVYRHLPAIMYTSVHWMKKRGYIRNLAGQRLLMPDVASLLLRDVTNKLVDNEDNRDRMMAAETLEHLCSNYTEDDSHLKELKQATVLQMLPKVLRELLVHGSISTGIQAEREPNEDTRYSAPDSDLEEGRVLIDNYDQKNINSTHEGSGEQHDGRKLQEALLSLCETVCYKFIDTDPDLAHRLAEIASEICSEHGKPIKDFTLLVEEARGIVKGRVPAWTLQSVS